MDIQSLSIVFEDGVNKIWKEDEREQTIALYKVIDNIRGVSKNLRERYFSYLRNLGAFYVFTETYIAEKFGAQLTMPVYNIYNNFGGCNYESKLVIPIRGFDKKIKALCAYDNGNELDTFDFAKYVYSNDVIWSKQSYCFMSREEYEKSLTDGYVCIVDGIFDKISLSVLGINAVSLMGSNLSDTNKIVLDFIPNKIIVRDNDVAGKKLLKKCQRYLDNVYDYAQVEAWDIDDYLKNISNQDKFKNNLHELLNRKFTFGGRS